MNSKLSVSSLLKSVKEYDKSNDFHNMLLAVRDLLKKDPCNGEYLLYQLKALEGLGQVTQSLPIIKHYVNMRSTDITGFLLLYRIFIAEGNVAEAIISLVFALSIDEDDQECKLLLTNLLAEVDVKYKTAKINILTTNRVGHLVLEIESWVRSQQNKNDDCLYLFISDGKVSANESLFTLLKNYAHVIESPFWYEFYINRPLLLADRHYCLLPYDTQCELRGFDKTDIDTEGNKRLIQIYKEQAALVEIPPADIAAGWKMLEKYNLCKEDKIVCLHVRDSYYLEKKAPLLDFSYHDYRDADIATYKKAVSALIAKGYKVVRTGAETNQRLDINSPNYLDFCLDGPSEHGDFIEVMLISLCQFFIGTTSGPLGIAAIFDTPILSVNSAPLFPGYSRHSRFIPKRLFQNDIEVNLMEVCQGKALSKDNEKPIFLSFSDKELSSYNYKYLANSEDDILDAVLEFEERLHNRVLDATLTNNQASYMEKIPKESVFKNSDFVVCDSFLMKYPDIFK